MKTSKEMQLKIIDKMRENIEENINMMTGIEYEVVGKWYEVGKSISRFFNMNYMTYRLKPETITINGVKIPKPLHMSEMLGDIVYYCVDNNEFLYKQRKGQAIIDQGVMFAYETKEEAITASKALFGIE